MTKNLDNLGLRSVLKNYDLFFIDLWGVIHNGIELHKDAVEVLDAQSTLIGVGRVLSVISSSTFVLGDLPGVGEFNIAFIRRRLKKGNSSLHTNINNFHN